MLVALIVRGVSFEFSRKIDDPRWRSTWRWSLTIGSLLVPLLLGTALGDLLHGLPIDSAHNYTGSFFGLLVPFGLYTGVTLTVLSLFLGAAYLSLKTVGELHDRAVRLSGRLGWLAAAVTFGWLTWIHVGLGVGFLPNPFQVLALVAVVGAALFAESRSEGWAFAAAATAIGSVVGLDLLRALPPGDGVLDQHGLQPHRLQLGQPLLHAQGDDGGGGDLLPGGARLPGLEPLRVPEADRRAAGGRRPRLGR